MVKHGEESGQTPEETADGKGLGTLEEMKEAWGKWGLTLDLLSGLTGGSRWFLLQRLLPAFLSESKL